MNYLVIINGQSPDTKQKIQVTTSLNYDAKHRLAQLKIEGDVTDKFYEWFFKVVPILDEVKMKPFVHNLKNAKLVVVPEDLSFNKFWDTYNHKALSDKKRTEKKWFSMDETSRKKAIAHISVYDRHLFENPGLSKMYAETYLNKEQWNN